jgi:hypothetical protein
VAKDLRGFLKELQSEEPDQILRVKREVDPHIEVTGVAKLEKEGRMTSSWKTISPTGAARISRPPKKTPMLRCLWIFLTSLREAFLLARWALIRKREIYHRETPSTPRVGELILFGSRLPVFNDLNGAQRLNGLNGGFLAALIPGAPVSLPA